MKVVWTCFLRRCCFLRSTDRFNPSYLSHDKLTDDCLTTELLIAVAARLLDFVKWLLVVGVDFLVMLHIYKNYLYCDKLLGFWSTKELSNFALTFWDCSGLWGDLLNLVWPADTFLEWGDLLVTLN